MPALKRGATNAGRFGILLVALLAIFAVAPFAERHQGPVQPLSLAFSAALVAGVYSVARRPRVLKLALLVAIPALAIEWLSNYYPTTTAVVVNLCLLGLFVAFVAAVILLEVLEESRVTLDTIFGGVAIYLLIGLAWTFGYAVIEHLEPGSFPLGEAPLQSLRQPFEFVFPELIYFSFVTLTTLGYGDMAPATQPARIFAIFEAITGQLYVAIFIARLVALHITHQRDKQQS